MGVDITQLFKACVKTVRTRNRARGVTDGDADKNRLLNPKPAGEFNGRSKDIVSTVTKLRDFLLENRNKYLGHPTSMYIKGKEGSMSDLEREHIDGGAQKVMKTCTTMIRDLTKDAGKDEPNQQTLHHRQAVVDLLQVYLKSVCSVYSEQRAIRVKRAVDRQKLSRIEPKREQHSFTLSEKAKESIEEKEDSSVPSTPTKKSLSLDYSQEQEDEDYSLSPEEIQMFEKENAQLHNQLNSVVNEVRQIEGKVVKISELQQIFTEKVLEQESDINRISTMVSGTTDNIKDANEQIKEAMKQNTGFRVWVIFFICVLSFSLLFLDWYND